MKMKRVYGMAVRAIVVSGIAAAAMFMVRSVARKKTHSREIPVE